MLKASLGGKPLDGSPRPPAADKSDESAAAWRACPCGPETAPGSHPVLRRMNEIQHLGTPDSRDGSDYLYSGAVGDGAKRETMTAQIYEHAGDVCIWFWTVDGRFRRLLVTSQGETWIALGVRAVRHTGKYLRAWRQLVQVRVTIGQGADGTGEAPRG